MEDQNGVQVFRPGDPLPPLPSEDLERSAPPSQYGHKISEKDGQFIWIEATETDFRTSEAQRLGIDPDKVEITYGCSQTGPRECTMYYCGNGHSCGLVYNPKGEYYYCACI